jgi:cytochrome c-type biogenesis protein CcmF
MSMQVLGNLFLALGLVAAAISIGSLVWGNSMREKEGESLTNMGYLATFAVFGSVTISVAILVVGFMGENFAFQYVAENHPTDVSRLAWLYRLSGLWAGREGSLLFWEWLLALFAGYVAYKRLAVTDKLSNMAIAVTNSVQIFFLVALFIEKNNPFKVTPAEWLGPNGELLIAAAMNPLLQHWAMILHPPTLFIGYAGLAIPFAFAIAAILVNDGSAAWVKLVDRITIFSWLFLGIGIGLGAIWAYVVLGWGGYWAWDPVENASLLPWLTGVGLLHSFTVYRRRDGFKRWAIMLSSITFVLVLLGTFITRSGVVQSVHAFEQDPWSLYWFLAMMIASFAVAAIGLLMRGDTFSGQDEFESLVSKEASYYFNNVLMLVASVLVAYWTLAPALPTWLPGGGQSFGPPTYDSVARPVGILYAFIMAACPILSWRVTDAATFWKRAKWPLAGTGVLGGLLLVIWATQLWPIYAGDNPGAAWASTYSHGWLAIVGLLVGAFAIAVPSYLFYEGARRRSAAKGEGWFTAFINLFVKARSQSGGYLTHLGIGIIVVGLVGSAMFVDDIQVSLEDVPQSSFEAGGFTFVYQGIENRVLENGDEESLAGFQVYEGDRLVKTLTPSIYFHTVQGQSTRHVDIVYEPLRDVFFIFEGINPDGSIAVNVKVNPLISFVWFGFVLTIIGTAIAVWPKRTSADA